MIKYNLTFSNGTLEQQDAIAYAFPIASSEWSPYFAREGVINITVSFTELANNHIAETTPYAVTDDYGILRARSYYKIMPSVFNTDNDRLPDALMDFDNDLMWQYDLGVVVEHEMGHVFGMSHVLNGTSEIMSPYYDGHKYVSDIDLEMLRGLGYAVFSDRGFAVVHYAPDQEIVA